MTVIVDRNSWNVENNVDGFELTEIEPILALVDGYMNAPIALLTEDSEETVSAVSRATGPSKDGVPEHVNQLINEFRSLKESGNKIYLYQIQQHLIRDGYVVGQSELDADSTTNVQYSPVDTLVKVRFATSRG